MILDGIDMDGLTDEGAHGRSCVVVLNS